MLRPGAEWLGRGGLISPFFKRREGMGDDEHFEAYQTNWVKPWFVYWRDALEPKYLWRGETSQIYSY